MAKNLLSEEKMKELAKSVSADETSFVNYYQFKINEERKIFSNKYILFEKLLCKLLPEHKILKFLYLN